MGVPGEPATGNAGPLLTARRAPGARISGRAVANGPPSAVETIRKEVNSRPSISERDGDFRGVLTIAIAPDVRA